MTVCLFLHVPAGARHTSAGTIPGYIEAISSCCIQDVWLSLLIDVVYGEGGGSGLGEGRERGWEDKTKGGRVEDWKGEEEDEKDSWQRFKGREKEAQEKGLGRLQEVISFWGHDFKFEVVPNCDVTDNSRFFFL